MQRRNLLKRLGTAGVATAWFSGVAAASSGPGLDLNIDREIDVSDVSGPVPLADLLPDADLDGVSRFDPERLHLVVDPDADGISPQSDCCTGIHCCERVRNCRCDCCTCFNCTE